MIIKVDVSFEKDFKKLKNRELQTRIIQKIEELEVKDHVNNLANIKKMQGFSNFYRLRVGEYRIGFELENETTLVLLRVAHRKDIYSIFP